VEQGVPPEFVDRGATTVAQYQQMAATDLSDRQIQAQRDIAAQQLQFNQQQVDAQQAQFEQQQQQARDQAARQTEYDTGRASQLADATSQIDSAFSQDGHGYFNGDFNYDGHIDGGDYGIIDNNIQAQGAPL